MTRLPPFQANHKVRSPTPRYVVATEIRFRPSLWLVALIAFAAGFGTNSLVMSRSESGGLPTSGAPTSPAPAQPPPADPNALPRARATVLLGNSYYDHQQWAEAVEKYQAAIAAGMDNADVRTDLGNCFRFLGQSQQALEQYNRAQMLDPLHENSLLNKAGLYVEVLHDSDRALSAAREFLRRFPDGGATSAVRRLVAELEAGAGARLADPRVFDWNPKPQHTTFRGHQSDAGTLR